MPECQMCIDCEEIVRLAAGISIIQIMIIINIIELKWYMIQMLHHSNSIVEHELGYATDYWYNDNVTAVHQWNLSEDNWDYVENVIYVSDDSSGNESDDSNDSGYNELT